MADYIFVYYFSLRGWQSKNPISKKGEKNIGFFLLYYEYSFIYLLKSILSIYFCGVTTIFKLQINFHFVKNTTLEVELEPAAQESPTTAVPVLAI